MDDWLSAGLVCLLHCNPLMEYILSGRAQADINVENPLGSKGEIMTAFVQLARRYWSGREKVVDPSALKNVLERIWPQYEGDVGHDCSDFLCFLLESGLMEDVNQTSKRPVYEGVDPKLPESEAAEKSWKQHMARSDSYVSELFTGLYRVKSWCTACDGIDGFASVLSMLWQAKSDCTACNGVTSFDPMMWLSLDCAGHFMLSDVIGGMKEPHSEIERFFPSCTHPHDHLFSSDVWRLPKILFIQKKPCSRAIIEIDYPLVLDLTHVLAGPREVEPVYDLYAVVCCDKGCYYTYSFNINEKSWFRFGDEGVKQVASEGVISRNAYLLFYQRRDVANPRHLRLCGLPGCSAYKTGMGKCGKCKLVYYCTEDHQLSHWPEHKKECGSAKK